VGSQECAPWSELEFSKNPGLSHMGNACGVPMCWVERSKRQSTQLVFLTSDPK
jgi:hypothetical protein